MTYRAQMLGVLARLFLPQHRSLLPGGLRHHQALQAFVLCWRRIEGIGETFVRFVIEHEQSLVEQDFGRLAARRFQHEFRPVLAHSLRSSINQSAFRTICAKVNRDPSRAVFTSISSPHWFLLSSQ